MFDSCENCGGHMIPMDAMNYEYACDTCCMHLRNGVWISIDCECKEPHNEKLIFVSDQTY